MSWFKPKNFVLLFLLFSIINVNAVEVPLTDEEIQKTLNELAVNYVSKSSSVSSVDQLPPLTCAEPDSASVNLPNPLPEFNRISWNQLPYWGTAFDEFFEAVEQNIYLNSACGRDNFPLISKIINLGYQTKYLSCGITPSEAAAINCYTQSGYIKLNEALYTKSDLSDRQKFIDLLDRALSKLANYEGWVRRGASTLGKIVLQEGNSIQIPAYMSTSYESGFQKEVSFLIHSRYCKYIAPFSSYLNEKEILCPHNSIFKVIKNKQLDYRNYYLLDQAEMEP